MTNHTRPARSWTAALPLLGMTTAVLIVLAAIVLLRPGQSPVAAIGSAPSPTPDATVEPASTQAQAVAEPDPSPSPSPSPKASPRSTPAALPMASVAATTPTCGAVELSARITAWDGAAGSRIAEVELRNDATAACIVAEPSALRLIASDGTVLIDSAKTGGMPSASPGEPALKVAAGASVRTDVRVANYCGPEPKGSIGVSFNLPGSGGTVVAIPAAGVSSADAIPPCNGPIGADIEMNGWRS